MEDEKLEKDLVVDSSSAEVKLALMENHRLIEYSRESLEGKSFVVGDVFLGRVKKILPQLNAAFVDIGDSKEAFIHYLDLGIHFKAFDRFVKESNPNRDMKSLFSQMPLTEPVEKDGQPCRYVIYASKETQLDISRPENIVCIVREPEYTYNLLSATLYDLHLAITALDRFGNESAPLEIED